MQDQLRHLHEPLSEKIAGTKELGLTLYGLDIRSAVVCIRFKGFCAITS